MVVCLSLCQSWLFQKHPSIQRVPSLTFSLSHTLALSLTPPHVSGGQAGLHLICNESAQGRKEGAEGEGPLLVLLCAHKVCKPRGAAEQKGKENRVWGHTTWAGVLTLPLISCVTLGQLCNLSAPRFSSNVKMGMITVLTLKDCLDNVVSQIVKHLKQSLAYCQWYISAFEIKNKTFNVSGSHVISIFLNLAIPQL